LPPDSYRDPVDGRALAGHDETVLTVSSQGDGYEFWVKMK